MIEIDKLLVLMYGAIPTDAVSDAIVVYQQTFPPVEPSARKKYVSVPHSEDVTVGKLICPFPLVFTPDAAELQTVARSSFTMATRAYPQAVDGSPVIPPVELTAVAIPAYHVDGTV